MAVFPAVAVFLLSRPLNRLSIRQVVPVSFKKIVDFLCQRQTFSYTVASNQAARCRFEQKVLTVFSENALERLLMRFFVELARHLL
tara:strand:+ start:415 stop:672 length:258 start_codon:yes stop_codon:yes gene_type:complete